MSKAIAKQVARIFRKHGISYEQSKNIFKEVRQELDLKPKPSQNKGTVKRLSRAELESFINAAFDKSAKVGLMMMVLYETGCRVDEFCNLETEDIYFQEMKIVVKSGKGDKRREVPISKSLTKSLKIWLNNRAHGFLFINTRYRKFSARSIQLICKDLRQAAGIKLDLTPHTLRHTRATLLAEDGLEKDLLAKFLGHSKTETTEIYTNTANLKLNQKFRELETR
jgi:integrase/recombinase XerD